MNVAVQQKESTDLVAMKVLTPAVVFAPGGVDEVLGKIRAEVQSIHADISTPAGRATIASVAYKIARSKTALDKMGKTLGEDHYKSWKAITSERARIEKELDALKDDFRKPLTDWENAEKKRVEDHEAALLAISDAATFAVPPDLGAIRGRLAALKDMPPRDWQEFAKRAAEAMADSTARLTAQLQAAEKQEAERIELERLRAEQIAREQAERDARIAAEAAEKARLEAETKARAEAEAAERRARQEQERVEQEKRRAEQAQREAEERAAKAERDRIAAEEKAKADAEAAAIRAEQAQKVAIEAERKRAADEKAAQEREAAAREANKRHRAKINGEARDALVAAGLSAVDATAAITAIALGSVPHTRISY